MALVDELRGRHSELEAQLATLRARAEAERQEMNRRHAAETDPLIEAMESIEKVIAFEASAAKLTLPAGTPVFQKGGRETLADYFVRQVRMEGRLTKEDLKTRAHRNGYFAEGDPGGRSTHAALLNLVRGRRLQEVADAADTYEIATTFFDVAPLYAVKPRNEEGSPAEASEPSKEVTVTKRRL